MRNKKPETKQRKKLAEVVYNSLCRENEQVFCSCGNPRSHKLVYCNKCGSFFEAGYKPSTKGEMVKWLISKSNRSMRYPIKWFANLEYITIKKQVNWEITESEIVDEIKMQLKHKF